MGPLGIAPGGGLFSQGLARVLRVFVLVAPDESSFSLPDDGGALAGTLSRHEGSPSLVVADADTGDA